MPLLCQGCLSPLVYLMGQGVNFYQKPQWEKHARQWYQSTFVCQLLSELLHDKYLSLPNDNHLYCVASEHTGGQLGRKEKAAFSIEYQFVYTFWGKSIEDALSPSGQPTSFSCSLEFLNQKYVEFSSELNGTIGRFLWWILRELELFKCPKVQKYQKIHFEAERVKLNHVPHSIVLHTKNKYWPLSSTTFTMDTSASTWIKKTQFLCWPVCSQQVQNFQWKNTAFTYVKVSF